MLVVDGAEVGPRRPTRSPFSGDETTDAGSDAATPGDDYSGGHCFIGRVRWVQIDIDEVADDLVRPDEVRVAMARR